MKAWLLGVAGAAMCAGGLAWNLHGALAAYLCGWLFLLGLSLGALELMMLHALAGGRWFVLVRGSLAASMKSIWLVALLFVPVLIWGFGADGLWPAPAASSPARWLAPRAIALRSFVYLGVWLWLAASCQWLRARHGRVPPGAAALVLIVYLVSITAAAFDWIAALQPGWYSSGLGLLLAAAQALGAMALAIGGSASLRRDRQRKSRRDRFNDLGNVLLMLVMFWAYLEFMQLLVIWSENLPREIAWYLPRWSTSWLWIGGALALFQFGVPMAALLARAAKRSGRALATLALAVLAANFIEAVWLVLPTLRPRGVEISVADLLAAGGVVALWFAFWWRDVQRLESRHA
jgi:hypothetical protein